MGSAIFIRRVLLLISLYCFSNAQVQPLSQYESQTDNSFNNNELKNPPYFFQPVFEDENEENNLSEILSKRRVPPLGFYNGRGKKDNLANGIGNGDSILEYIDEYPKGRAWDFIGVRGRRDYVEDYDDSSIYEEKRQPLSGFFATRGKKMRPNGFFAMRGKRVPEDFSGKTYKYFPSGFFAMRGKRVPDDINGSEYYGSDTDENTDLKRLLYLTSIKNQQKQNYSN